MVPPPPTPPAARLPKQGHGARRIRRLSRLDARRLRLLPRRLLADRHRSGVSPLRQSQIALSLTLTLAFRPVGAFIFGLMADRYGRRIPLDDRPRLLLRGRGGNRFRAQFHHLPRAARVVRHRHGRRVGRGRLARHGKGSTPAARLSFRPAPAGIRARLPSGRRSVSTSSFRAGAGGRCFLSEDSPLCSASSSASK